MSLLKNHSTQMPHSMMSKKTIGPSSRKETSPSKHHNDSVSSRGKGRGAGLPSNRNTASTP